MKIAHGPSIGKYYDKPIPAWIEEDGVRFDFDRIAVETSGGVALRQLADNECVIAPGLIYRRATGRA